MKKTLLLLIIAGLSVKVYCSDKDPVFNTDSLKQLNTTSFIFVEGPAWDSAKYVYFSDIPAKKIYRYSKADGIEVFVNNDVGTNGIIHTPDSLIVCENGGLRVSSFSFEGNRMNILSDGIGEDNFNGPNDLVMDESGGIYFTDPAFGNQSIPEESVYYIDNDGLTSRVINDLGKPNGVVISPDGKKLIVNDTFDENVYCWDITSPGVVENMRVFCNLTMDPSKGDESGADGMAYDKLGNLYIATVVGIQVFDSTGTAIETISLPKRPTNCTFGGENMDELYITAQDAFYMLPVEFPETSNVGYGSEVSDITDIQIRYSNDAAVISNIPFNSSVFLYDICGRLITRKGNIQGTYSVERSQHQNQILLAKITGRLHGKNFLTMNKIFF